VPRVGQKPPSVRVPHRCPTPLCARLDAVGSSGLWNPKLPESVSSSNTSRQRGERCARGGWGEDGSGGSHPEEEYGTGTMGEVGRDLPHPPLTRQMMMRLVCRARAGAAGRMGERIEGGGQGGGMGCWMKRWGG
jgi:hypothetical protein